MAQLQIRQSSTNAPAQPAYVLRGHAAQIHAVIFSPGNDRLITGDAEGWVVSWDTTIKRAVAVWRAHKNSILGLAFWDNDKLITHGRDNKIYVWQIRGRQDESQLSTTLPIDDSTTERKQPWLLHTLDVSSINFCSFAMCSDPRPAAKVDQSSSILLATPGVQDGHVNITSLPVEARIATLPNPRDVKTGMVMALGIHSQGIEAQTHLFVVAGYESGHTCIWQDTTPDRAHAAQASSPWSHWQLIYSHTSHTQPVLSLSISPSQQAVYTSSADAIIAKHCLKSTAQPDDVAQTIQTKHAGQQSLNLRSDGKIFATAGWDGRARVYSAKTMKELAVLKWHREGCYALAFAHILPEDPVNDDSGKEASLTTRHAIDGSTVASRRARAAKTTHWLALGSKDGKVSLWDIY